MGGLEVYHPYRAIEGGVFMSSAAKYGQVLYYQLLSIA